MYEASLILEGALKDIFIHATKAYEKMQVYSSEIMSYEQNSQKEYELASAAGTILDRQKRVEQLSKLVEHARKKASNVFEKVALSYIRHTPPSSTNFVVQNEEEVSIAFKEASEAYLELIRTLLELAQSYLSLHRWAEVRGITSLLLDSSGIEHSLLYNEFYSCLCESYYLPAMEATANHDWQTARQEFEELLKFDDMYKDAQAHLCEVYYSLADQASQEENFDEAARYLRSLHTLNPKHKSMIDLLQHAPYFFWHEGTLHADRDFFSEMEMTISFDENTCMDISRDGKYLAIGSLDSSIKIYDLRTQQLIYRLLKHEGKINSVAFSPEQSTRLASAGEDGYVRLWNLVTGTEIRSHRYSESIHEVAFLPGTNYLSSKSIIPDADQQTHIRKVADLLIQHTLDLTSCVAFDPQKGLLAQGLQNGKVIVENMKRRSEKIWKYSHNAGITNLYFLFNDGNHHLCSVSQDDTISILNLDTKEHRTYPGYKMAFLEEKGILASVAKDNLLRLWRIGERDPDTTFVLPQALKGKNISTLFFFLSGKLLMMHSDNLIMIVNTASLPTGSKLELPPLRSWEHSDGRIISICMSPDLPRLFALDEYGTCIVLNAQIDGIVL